MFNVAPALSPTCRLPLLEARLAPGARVKVPPPMMVLPEPLMLPA